MTASSQTGGKELNCDAAENVLEVESSSQGELNCDTNPTSTLDEESVPFLDSIMTASSQIGGKELNCDAAENVLEVESLSQGGLNCDTNPTPTFDEEESVPFLDIMTASSQLGGKGQAETAPSLLVLNCDVDLNGVLVPSLEDVVMSPYEEVLELSVPGSPSKNSTEDDSSGEEYIPSKNEMLQEWTDSDYSEEDCTPGNNKTDTNTSEWIPVNNKKSDPDLSEKCIPGKSKKADPDLSEEEYISSKGSEDDMKKREKSPERKKIFQTKQDKKSHKYNYDPKSVFDFDDDHEEVKVIQPDQLKSQVTDNKGGRVWNKLSACKYCDYVGTGKLDLHLEAKHPDEDDVKMLLIYKKDPKIKLNTKEEIEADKERKKKRTKIMEGLRNDGMHKHNMKLIIEGKAHREESKNVLLCKRRDKFVRKLEDIVACTECNGFMSRHQLPVHMKNKHAIKPGRNAQCKASASMPVAKSVSEDFKTKVLDRLQQGNLRLIIRNDPLIIAFGERLFNKHNNKDQPKILEHIRIKMRELAKLKKTASDLDPKIHQLEDLFEPANFDLVVNATKARCQYDENKKLFRNGSLAKNLGHHISKCIGILKGQYIRAENDVKLKKVKKFESLKEIHWTDDVSRAALLRLNRKHMAKPQAFPLAKDVQKFVKVLKNKTKEALQILEEDDHNKTGFKMLMESTLIQVILFNRRRSGDVERLLLETYINPVETRTHEDILHCLSKTEKKLLKELTLIKTPGKGRKMVPILLTKKMKEALDMLCKTRNNFPEFAENQFLFCTTTAMEHCNACSIFRKHANEAELEKPEFVRSRYLRSHVGTMAIILNLGKSGLRILSKLMGHSEEVHCKFYELPEDTLLAKASKVLYAIDRGIYKYKGKSLDEIDIDVDEELPEDEPDEQQEQEEDALDREKEEKTAEKEEEVTESEKNKTKKKKKITQRQAKKRRLDEEEMGSEDDVPSEKKKKKGNQVSWSDKEKDKLRKYFIEELSSVGVHAGKMQPKWPKEKKCSKFLQKYEISGRTWKNVKDFIANQMKTRIKKRTGEV